MVKERFKLPRSSYEELRKIIIAYNNFGKPGSVKDIISIAKVPETVLSHNHKFLLATAIIEGGQKKVITEKGKELARALEYGQEEDIAAGWKTITNETEFLTKMVQAVRVREGMEINELKNHIAYSASEPKGAAVLTGAGTVISILVKSGLVAEEGDRIIPVKLGEVKMREKEKESEEKTETHATTEPLKEDTGKINIVINIHVLASELNDLPVAITRLINELKKREIDNNEL